MLPPCARPFRVAASFALIALLLCLLALSLLVLFPHQSPAALAMPEPAPHLDSGPDYDLTPTLWVSLPVAIAPVTSSFQTTLLGPDAFSVYDPGGMWWMGGGVFATAITGHVPVGVIFRWESSAYGKRMCKEGHPSWGYLDATPCLWSNTSDSLGSGLLCHARPITNPNMTANQVCQAVAGINSLGTNFVWPEANSYLGMAFMQLSLKYGGTNPKSNYFAVRDIRLIYHSAQPVPPGRGILSGCGGPKGGVGGPPGGGDPRECPSSSYGGSQGSTGDPINTRTGGFDLSVVDLSIPTLAGPLAFQRTYASPATSLYTTPLGYGWTHNHDTRLIFPGDPGGEEGIVWFKAHSANQYRFTITSTGSYTSYIPYPGVLASLAYISPHYVLTNSAQAVYQFDASGKLIAWTDPQGHSLTYTYSAGQLSRVTDPSGQRYLSFAYNPQGQLVSVSDHTSRTVSFAYDPAGDLVTVTNLLSQPWSYAYDAAHRLTHIIDPDGTVILRTDYDDNGRAVRQYDGLGNPTVQITYTPGATTTTTVIADALNRIVTHTYDSRNLLVSTSDAVGRSTRSYDLNFRPSYLGDANGNVTQLNWSADGTNLIHMADAENNHTYMAYDSRNHLTRTVDARGYTTTYEYVGNLLITTTDALSGTVVNTYNDQGLLIRAVNHGLTTTYEYDAFGQRTVVTDTAENPTRYEYDAVGRLITTTALGGLVTVNQYDNSDHLIRVTRNYTTAGGQNYLDEYNLVTQYSYDKAGRQIAMTDTLGSVTRSYYDNAGRLISTTVNYTATSDEQNYLGLYNLITRYAYDAVGNQVLVTDTLGHVTKTEYDALNRPVTVTTNFIQGGPFDAQTNLTRTTGYDPVGNVVTQTDTLGRMTVTRYDRVYRPLTVTTNYQDGVYNPSYPDEDVQTATRYDPAGNVVARYDAAGQKTTLAYDALGRLITTTNPLSGTTVTQYNAAGQRVATMDPAGHVTRYEYDAAGRLVTTTRSVEGGAWSVESVTVYDTLGRRVASVNALGYRTVYTYSPTGRLIATGSPDGAVTQYEYDALGRTVVVTDALGHATRAGYDALGRAVTVTRSMEGGAWSVQSVTQYDALGRRTATQDARGNWTTFEYDALGRIITTTDATGRATVVTYDRAGNQIQISNQQSTISNQYDALGRLIAQSDALSNTTRYGYDALGSRVVMTDANGVVTRYEYDALSRLITVTENYTTTGLADYQTNVVTRYGYDKVGNRTVITNARGYTTTFTYDAFNRLVSERDPLGNITRHQYDAVGNRTVMTDANGAVTLYAYDAMNRPRVITYTADATMVRYAYDKMGNRVAMTDSTGVTSYVYDALYRPLTITSPFSGVVGYRYDANGNRTQTIYPDGKVVTYTYDAANRLTSVQDWQGQNTTYAYDPAGRLITTTLPNGVTTVNTYDAAGRLTQLDHAQGANLLARYEYELDRVGNRAAATETLTATTTVIRYTYDPLQRLTGAAYSGAYTYTFAYAYDKVGNRTISTQTITSTLVMAHTYNAANRLTNRAMSDGRTYTYTWSNAGQLLAERTQGIATRVFTYTAAGQLAETSLFTLTTRFTYDGDGARRVVNVVGRGATTYTLDYAAGNRILAEGTITSTTLYLYGHDCLGEYTSAWLYYLPDASGYVRQGTDSQGQVTSAWTFDPDGTVLIGPQGLVSHLVCGGVYDWSTGLLYKGGRYFDPMLGIWLALMPLIVVQSWRGRRRGRRGLFWYLVVLCIVVTGGTLVACGGSPPTPPPTPCTWTPPPPPGPPPSKCDPTEAKIWKDPETKWRVTTDHPAVVKSDRPVVAKLLTFRYEVIRPDLDVRDYVFVQFIRGYDKNMVTGQFDSNTRLGKYQDTNYPDWVFDSTNSTPAYGDGNCPGGWCYAAVGQMAVTQDYPAVQLNTKRSLSCQMCVFRSREVPKNWDVQVQGPESSLMSKACDCVDWGMNVMYYKENGKEVFKKDPACTVIDMGY